MNHVVVTSARTASSLHDALKAQSMLKTIIVLENMVNLPNKHAKLRNTLGPQGQILSEVV